MGVSVSAVIVSWNNKTAALKAVEKVLSQEVSFDLKVMVVDNCSTDGTPDAIRERFPAVEVIVNERNLGGAGGFHVGMTAALKKKCDYLWLLDNDAYAEPFCAENAVKALEKEENKGLVALGSMILLDSDPATVQECGGRWHRWTGAIILVNAGAKTSSIGQSLVAVDYSPACSLFVRADAARNLGLIDRDIFFYFDDVEWCYRLQEDGGKVAALPTSRVRHEFGGKKPIVGRRIYYSRRNGKTFLFDRLRTSPPQDIARILFRVVIGHLEFAFFICCARFDLLLSSLIAWRDYFLNRRGAGDSTIVKSDEIHPWHVNRKADITSLHGRKILLLGFHHFSEVQMFARSLDQSFAKPKSLTLLDPTPEIKAGLASNKTIEQMIFNPGIVGLVRGALRLFIGRYSIIVCNRRFDSFSFLGSRSYHFDETGLYHHRMRPMGRSLIAVFLVMIVFPITSGILTLSTILKSKIIPNRYKNQEPAVSEVMTTTEVRERIVEAR